MKLPLSLVLLLLTGCWLCPSPRAGVPLQDCAEAHPESLELEDEWWAAIDD